jgi:hypothetical protein
MFSHNHVSLLKLELSGFALAPHTSFLADWDLVRNTDALSMDCIREQGFIGHSPYVESGKARFASSY